ncbi:type II secretion system secretin GspD [Thauera linaloolentis]|uniref:General secretion pathway protein D n=1 Tax=Thauera linaloolentis (strain DSM 12138 / JCM 21573 / CCUG 41526 / CIP 105981 / IAM 15112 / NBRC 102519 / 47Lol) TaxID=1123367 RepID=N6YRW5_THAL4|nr:type II secretion system secretin GspD [Thauera linaloolentis]ENO85112.1 general secretion pathway protein D [Thauera linaloolentis 47Lol = DSM 12138]MCM8565872.1 type II secretion system secretin GspD [Thauera linaloolentis]
MMMPPCPPTFASPGRASAPPQRLPAIRARRATLQFGHWLRTACLCALLSHGGTGWSQQSGGEPISLNFQNAEIDGVIHAIGRLTGHNFLIDPRVKGKLNIVTNTPIPRELSYQVLLSALRLQGFTAVEGEGVIKIVPEADAKQHAAPVSPARRGAQGVRGDRLVTQVFPLKFESATQMVGVVRPLVSPNNTVTAFPSNNTLVVTDYASNIEQIAAVISSIDVSQSDVAVFELQHAAAADLAPILARLLGEQGGTGGQGGPGAPQIMAEPRSNALLVRAENPSRISAIRQLIASLDRPGAGANIHVVYLRNADARQVAATLNAALSGTTRTATDGGTGTQPLTRATATTTDSGGGISTTGTGASLATAGSQRTPLEQGDGSGTVQADPVNNALIISAPDAIYRNLRQVIDQLDRRRAQVYIEALIAEISTERAAEFGLQWVGAGSSGSAGIIGGTAFGSGGNNLLQLIGSTANGGTPSLPGNGLNLAIGGGKVNIPGIGEVFSLGVLARFLENEVSANILSTPNIVTLDNEEAKIVVGRNLPFVTGQYTNTGGGTTPANPFQTIERRDVGLTLQVRPQISEGGSIRLQIYQEASAVLGNVDAANGPVTTKRSIESMVLVDDGAIIALGGLVEDSYSGGEEKVPMLGDLPVAGSLFRYNTRKRSKTNLVVFLRPVILRDRDSYADLSQSRYEYVIGQQRASAAPAELMRGEPVAPELPPIVDARVVPVAELLIRPAPGGGTPADGKR